LGTLRRLGFKRHTGSPGLDQLGLALLGCPIKVIGLDDKDDTVGIALAQMLQARVNSIAETINWIFIGLESTGKQGFQLISKRKLST
jgi:hypothetical protein